MISLFAGIGGFDLGCAQAAHLSEANSNFMNNNDEALKPTQYGESAHIDIWYPRVPDEPDDKKPSIRSIVVGLMDVRSADDIRVSYDFERDGWKIEQASTFEWDGDDEVCDPDWQEVAFVQAWGRKKQSGAEAPAADSPNGGSERRLPEKKL